MTSLARSRHWELSPCDIAAAQAIEKACAVSPLVSRVMASRGIATPHEAMEFLHPSLARDWVDPARIPGLMDVCDRLERAIRDNEHIAVFGDFDVDGISATCLLTNALRELGALVTPFIPRRFDEGYGLSAIALDRLSELGDHGLIVTVDTGIAGAEEVADLLASGVDVVVTDHHEPGSLVPRGIPVCDPKLDPDCPSRELAGVGVALKVTCELGRRFGKPDMWLDYIDIATLGTVSDMMLLRGENRSIVAEGIRKLQSAPRVGLAALAAQARRSIETITADELAFSLIPRLNAAGRMDDPAIALDLLMAEDPRRAEELAVELEDINRQRRDIESELSETAARAATDHLPGAHVIVVGGENWHEGVKGIVASRLANRYHVPVLIFTIADGIARGSGRSVGSIDLFHAVESCQDILVRFGGHAGAVGVTLEADKLDELRTRLEAIFSKLPPDAFEDKRKIASLVSLSELDIDTVQSLSVLQPFGQGNETPILATPCVTMLDRRRRGENGQHMSFVATDGLCSVQAIMFNAEDVETLAEYDGAADIVFEPKIESWQGRVSCKLHIRDVLRRDSESLGDVSAKTTELVDELFDNADSCLVQDGYEGLADAGRFFTKVAGVTFEGRQVALGRVAEGAALRLVREPQNPYDPNAIAVRTLQGEQLGYLKRPVSAAIAPNMDNGVEYRATAMTLTGGNDDRSYGLNILVEAVGNEDDVQMAEAEGSVERARLAKLEPEALLDELRRVLLGDREFLPAQRQALDNLRDGTNTLCIMATGRGKSLIFHIHAACEAIVANRASIFVFPLRALVSDQAYHLSQVFDRLGMKACVLTGETALEDRDSVFMAIAGGSADVVLTTPEFLAIHADRFAATGRIGFLVVDEAHHAGQSASGARSAYQDFPRVIRALGNPRVLAVTATANNQVAAEIRRLLGITAQGVVIDPSCRQNLRVVDERNVAGREDRLVTLLASGEKTLVYVNSREQTVMLARMLRRRVWERGHQVAFYNGGLKRDVRASVEDAFRKGELRMVVSTSAFGEGVNLPDVRHVVLYHLPFDEVEFNQMSGRAGRDGGVSYIHLAYGMPDAHINERVLASDAPPREDLVTLYRVLMNQDRTSRLEGGRGFQTTNAELAQLCLGVQKNCSLNDKGVSNGISIFRELGFVEVTGYGAHRTISMIPSPVRMDLTQSIRYQEGLRAKQEFASYKCWAFATAALDVLGKINSPIIPL